MTHKHETCRVCEETKPIDDFAKDEDGPRNICKVCACDQQKSYYQRNKDRLLKAQRELRRKNKKTVVEHYGGRCICCGEDRIEFLTMDHIHGGGNEHRRRVTHNRGGTAFYHWIMKNDYPEGILQVLCENCNQSKQRYGYCPHEKNEVMRNRQAVEELSAEMARLWADRIEQYFLGAQIVDALRAYAERMEK